MFVLRHIAGTRQTILLEHGYYPKGRDCATIYGVVNTQIWMCTLIDVRKLNKEEHDLGGYWWPPTYSNWHLLTIFSSTLSSVIICNCGFYTSGDV